MEPIYHQHFESPEQPAAYIERLRELPAHLGFIDSPDMATVREQMINEFMSNGEALSAAQYRTLGESEVEKKTGDDYPRAQLGLMISVALLRRDIQQVDDFRGDVVAAYVFAEHMGYDDALPDIESVLSNELANILRALGDEYGFDSETCDELASSAFEDAYESVYSYLSQTGLDADQVLAAFTEN